MVSIKEIKNICVIGEGKMGSSIFLYLNGFNYQLAWLCSSETEKEKAQKTFNKKTKLLFQSAVLTETEFEFKSSTTKITASVDDLKDCDLLIEAITEDAGLKKRLFESLDKAVHADCIFTTNSSSILPSLLSPSVSRSDKLAGLHFFSPVSLKNYVELITNASTSPKVTEALRHFLLQIKKKPFQQNETNAFILNRLFLDIQTGSYHIFEEGRLSIKEIDDLVRAYLFPIGIFEFFDHVGIDIMLSSIKNYTKNAANQEFYAPLIQKMQELVALNRLGIKTKQGFYDYSHQEKKTDQSQNTVTEMDDYKLNTIKKLWGHFTRSLFSAIEENLCSREELADAVKDYTGMDRDPFRIEICH